MTSPAFLAALLDAARASEREEMAFRREADARIRDLAEHRVLGYRRYNVIRDMVQAATACTDEAASVTAQVTGFLREVNWIESSPAELPERDREVLVHLEALARAIHRSVHDQPGTEDAGAVERQLAHLEDWYRQDRGRELLALLDRYMPVTPVVDF